MCDVIWVIMQADEELLVFGLSVDLLQLGRKCSVNVWLVLLGMHVVLLSKFMRLAWAEKWNKKSAVAHHICYTMWPIIGGIYFMIKRESCSRRENYQNSVPTQRITWLKTCNIMHESYGLPFCFDFHFWCLVIMNRCIEKSFVQRNEFQEKNCCMNT